MHRSRLPLATWFQAAHLMTTHSNGMSALQLEAQLGVTYKTAWLLTQKLRRSMIDPNREHLEGVVEVDQTEITFRVGDAFFEPGNAGKILIAGAIEVIERDTNKPKPRRKGAKYLDTRSGRLRLAVIADNSAAFIEAFVRANVKPGATLITDGHASYPGLAGDYRHDPRVVGVMAANVVLRGATVIALMKRWALGTIMACAASTSIPTSMNSCFATIADFTGTSLSKRCSASPPTTRRRAIGTSSGAKARAKIRSPATPSHTTCRRT